MPIHDTGAGLSLKLQEALMVAFAELMQSDSSDTAANLVELIKDLRSVHNCYHLNDRVIINNLWGRIRSDANLLTALMNTTTTFVLELDSLPAAIDKLTNALVPFLSSSRIVDDEVMDKAPSISEVQAMFTSNSWLFFMVYASTQLRIVNSILIDYAPKGAGVAR